MSYFNNNWSKGKVSEESLYASSGSALSDYQPSSYQRGRKETKKKQNDTYDFDISQEDYSLSPAPQTGGRRGREATVYESAAQKVRRGSVDDRAKEILERARSLAPSAAAEPEGDYKTLQSTFAELMEGLDLPPAREEEEEGEEGRSPPFSADSPGALGRGRSFGSLGSLGSPDGDSLDISAADMEVGAFAARKMKERAAERRRRMSFDQPTYSSAASPLDPALLSAKAALSPEAVKARRASLSSTGGMGGAGAGAGFHMSAALSSIHHSQQGGRGYGSAERSDDAIYRMLNISAVNDSYERERALGRERGESLDVPSLPLRAPTSSLRRGEEKGEGEGEYTESYEGEEVEDGEERKGPQGRGEEEEEGYGEYTEDFEEPTQTQPPSSPAPSPPAPAPSLSTAEQIMQRWARGDPLGGLEGGQDEGERGADGGKEGEREREGKEREEREDSSPLFPKLRDGEGEGGQGLLVTSLPSFPLRGEGVGVAFTLPSWTEEDFRRREETEGEEERRQEDEEGEREEEGEERRERNGEERGEGEGREERGADEEAGEEEEGGYRGDFYEESEVKGEEEEEREVAGGIGGVEGGRSSRYSERGGESDEEEEEEGGLVALRWAMREGGGKKEKSAERVGEREQGGLREKEREKGKEKERERGDGTAGEGEEKKEGERANKGAINLSRFSQQDVKDFVASREERGRLAPSTVAKLKGGRGARQGGLTRRAPSLPVPKRGEEKEGVKSVERGESRGRGGGEREKVGRVGGESRERGGRGKALGGKAKAGARGERVGGESAFEQILKDTIETVKREYLSGEGGREGEGRRREGEEELRGVVRQLMKDIFQLQEREREVVWRERSLLLRESRVEGKEREWEREGQREGRERRRGLDGEWREELGRLRGEKEALERENSELKDALSARERELHELKERIFSSRQGGERNRGEAEQGGEGGSLSQLLEERGGQSEALQRILQRLHHKEGKSEKERDRGRGESKKGEREGAEGGEGERGEGALVSLPRADMESLLKDFAQTEKLLAGYHKENERYAQLFKEREREESARRASFFDQQEDLNRQLNKLKNSQSELKFSLKTEKQLRLELEREGRLRHLQEQLEEVRREAGERERGLQNALTSLRAHNNKLTEKIRQMEREDVEQLKKELKDTHERCVQAEQKVRWYVQNSVLEREGEEERGRLRKGMHRLRGELLRRGVSERQVQSLLERDEEGEGGEAQGTEKGERSSSSILPAHRSNPHDMRRVRDLEQKVKDLQAALLKRYPDSVAAIVAAAQADAGGVQGERVRALEREVAYLRGEVGEVAREGEGRLRALRVEYDQLKLKYEERERERERGGVEREKKGERGREGGGEGAGGEREGEAEKVRQFYLKKVEEMKARHEAQLRALKRGEERDGPPPPPPPLSAIEGELEKAQERVRALERELREVRREREEERARSPLPFSPSPAPVVAPPAAPPPSSLSPEQIRREMEEMVERTLSRFVQLLPSLSLPSPPASAQSAPVLPTPALAPSAASFSTPLAPAEGSLRQLERVAELWLAEKERYLLELREERLRGEALAREVGELRGELQRARPLPSPTALHFQLLERQLGEVEAQLQRRERALRGVLQEREEGHAAEREAMESRHARDLRERDEQLAQCRRELQGLLGELKKMRAQQVHHVQHAQ